MNHLILVLDSCRYDSFERAMVPAMRRAFEVLEGHAIATFTYPAHTAMFQGFFPHSRANRPLYNRFVDGGFRKDHPDRSVLVNIYLAGRAPHPSYGSIPSAFADSGYRTFASGGVSWFRSAGPMSLGFQTFRYSVSAEESLSAFERESAEGPFYGLLNFGETHRPYDSPWTESRRIESPVSGTGYASSYVEALHSKQIRALEYLDTIVEKVTDSLLRRDDLTLVCLCADHGETFGEDGCFGHGFYHPAVMSVPLAWSIIGRGRSVPVTNESLAMVCDS